MRKLKALLYDLVSVYFGGATIVWGQAKTVKPTNPLIALRTISIAGPYTSIAESVNGVPVSYKPSKTALQVDLFTKGAELTDDDGITGAYENTALNDLADFVNFVNSEYVENWCMNNDVSVIVSGPVRDLTELINDASWDYRAMVELEVGFTQVALGYTGTMYEDGVAYDDNGNPIPNPFEQTPSGGRTQELADDYTGWFEQVETEYEEESKQ
jgi:hypothetical protein